MARSSSKRLTPAEWKVMQVLYDRKQCAARDVCEVTAKESDWSTSTTKTILNRLVKKGYLKTTRVGNSFLSRPTRPLLEVLRRAADALLDNAMAGTMGPLLAYMVERSELSSEELTDLRSVVDQLAPGEDRK
jgi:predicted transcriptional regulator